MKAYQFDLTLEIQGTATTAYSDIILSSIGENENQALEKLVNFLNIKSVILNKSKLICESNTF